MNTRLHAQRVGDQAGVLAAGAAEAVQGESGDVVALRAETCLIALAMLRDSDADIALRDRMGVLRRSPVALPTRVARSAKACFVRCRV